MRLFECIGARQRRRRLARTPGIGPGARRDNRPDRARLSLALLTNRPEPRALPSLYHACGSRIGSRGWLGGEKGSLHERRRLFRLVAELTHFAARSAVCETDRAL